MVGYSFLDDSFIRNPMPVVPKTLTAARHSFIRGVYSAIPATSLPSVIEPESNMGSNIDTPCGVPCSASLALPKSSPCKTMPLVFMTRGEREARSSKFYPGANQPCRLLQRNGDVSPAILTCKMSSLYTAMGKGPDGNASRQSDSW